MGSGKQLQPSYLTNHHLFDELIELNGLHLLDWELMSNDCVVSLLGFVDILDLGAFIELPEDHALLVVVPECPPAFPVQLAALLHLDPCDVLNPVVSLLPCHPVDDLLHAGVYYPDEYEALLLEIREVEHAHPVLVLQGREPEVLDPGLGPGRAYDDHVEVLLLVDRGSAQVRQPLEVMIVPDYVGLDLEALSHYLAGEL